MTYVTKGNGCSNEFEDGEASVTYVTVFLGGRLVSDRLAEEQAGNPYGDNPDPCDRCRAFAARLDTGLCEWCTAEPSMCQCYLCLDRRARELAALHTRPPWQGPLPAPIGAPKAASDDGTDAYRRGRCRTCHVEPYRAGGTECVGCWRARTGRQPAPIAEIAETAERSPVR